MLFSYNQWVKYSRSTSQRIHGWIDAQFRNLTAKLCCCVKMCECGGGSGVSQVVCRHINSLHRSDGTLLGRSDSFLHSTHFRCQSWLVSYGRRHSAQKCRNLRTSLGETEYVVDEE